MKYDFNNPEHFKELEKQAYNGTIEVAGFPPAAYRYFDSLRLLYARFKYDDLSKAQAAEEKTRLLHQYEEAASEHERVLNVYKSYQDNIRAAGTLLSDIEKSTDIKEIAEKACKCIGLMTNDRTFYKRQAEKFEEVKP